MNKALFWVMVLLTLGFARAGHAAEPTTPPTTTPTTSVPTQANPVENAILSGINVRLDVAIQRAGDRPFCAIVAGNKLVVRKYISPVAAYKDHDLVAMEFLDARLVYMMDRTTHRFSGAYVGQPGVCAIELDIQVVDLVFIADSLRIALGEVKETDAIPTVERLAAMAGLPAKIMGRQYLPVELRHMDAAAGATHDTVQSTEKETKAP